MARLEDVIGYGTHAARPAAGSAGTIYYETDTNMLFRDNGSTWDALTFATGSAGAVLQVLYNRQTVDNGPLSATSWTAYPNLSQAITIVAGSNIRARLIGQFTVQNVGKCVMRLVIGSTTYQIGGIYNANGGAPCEGIAGEVVCVNPGAGTYTVSVEYQNDSGVNLFCRPATQTHETASLMVEETL